MSDVPNLQRPQDQIAGAIINSLRLATVLGIGFMALFFEIGATSALWGAFAFCTSVALGWFLLFCNIHRPAAIVINISLLVSTFWFILFSGGFHSPFLIWLACPPVIIGLLVNWRWSIVFGIGITLFTAGLKLNDHAVVHLSELQVTHTEGMSHVIAAISIISAVITLIFFTHQNAKSLNEAIIESQLKERTDSLTGVLNRSGFNQIIMNMVENKSSSFGALIMFDVDNFKGINDTYGHIFGDYVLQEIATSVASAIRGDDFLARIGGDEFACILPSASHQTAHSVGLRIKQNVDTLKLISANGETVHVTVSIGVATCETPELCETEPMMQLADEALYEAKDDINRIVVKDIENIGGPNYSTTLQPC